MLSLEDKAKPRNWIYHDVRKIPVDKWETEEMQAYLKQKMIPLEDAQQERDKRQKIWERVAHEYDCAIDGNLKRIRELEARLAEARQQLKNFPDQDVSMESVFAQHCFIAIDEWLAELRGILGEQGETKT